MCNKKKKKEDRSPEGQCCHWNGEARYFEETVAESCNLKGKVVANV
jgi:uncharacterized protein (DUF427 family)